jgi:hypothetical protein
MSRRRGEIVQGRHVGGVVQLPAGWGAVELDADDRWCASLQRRGDRYEVDCTRSGDSWVATVTQVRPGQRHRIALLQRPTLAATVKAAEELLDHA